MDFKEDKELGLSQGGMFVKLASGESVKGVLRGRINEFYSVFEDGKSNVVSKEDGGKFRFRVNFVVENEGDFTPKVLEQGATVYKQLRTISSDYDLEHTLIKITRNGEGTSTTYSVLPMPKPLAGEQLKKLDAVTLHELEVE